MNIDAKEIKKAIGNTYYKRGVEYYSAGRVLMMKEEIYRDEEDENAINLSSSVRGSGGNIYTQNIDIFFDYDEIEFVVAGRCSCPIRFNCKHVAAVCISYHVQKLSEKIETMGSKTLKPKPTPSADSLVNQWLENFEKTPSLTQHKRKTSYDGYFLTYRLDGSKEKDKNRVHFYKTKILKNGNISRGTRLEHDRVANSYSYSELKDTLDEDIIRMARAFLSKDYYRPVMEELSGSLGALLVKELIASGRCYYEYNQEPLSMAEEIFKVEFEFKSYAGEYLLKSNINKKDFHILKTSPLFVIDSANNKVVELDIDMQTYNKIQDAPKIPEQALSRVYTKLADNFPTLTLKAPKSIKIKKIQVEPIPRLYLKDNSFSLDFLYDDFIVQYYPSEIITNRMDGETKLEIERDLELEDEARLKLESLGFMFKRDADKLECKLDTKDRQAQLSMWRKFLSEDIELFRESGWIIKEHSTFDMKFEPSSEIVVESQDDSNDWFNLSFNLEFNGISQPIAPLVASIIEEFDNFESMPELINIEVDTNHFVEVKSKQIKPILKTIIELFDKKEQDDTLKISSFDAHLLDFVDDDVLWRGSKEILELSQKLKNFNGIKKVKPPKCMDAQLRDYQQDGLNWLNFLYEFKFCGILADDMGLGKTIQTLAHLSRLKEKKLLTNPSLIVMPTSLVANWKNEATKFTPNLRVLSLHGSDRAQKFDVLDEYDVLLTTYPLIVRDQKRLNEHRFFYIILDEAQKIKNHKTKMAVALKTLKSDHRLALSGTPIENHLGELWSIFSFLMPGFLDTVSFFKNYYQTPIEKEHNFERQNLLNKRIRPFMLRRTKEIVANELPAKSEIIKYTQFSDKQSQLYESIRVTMEKKVREAVSAKGLGSSHITILDALLKLRQVCCDPSLLKIQEAKKVEESAKLELFLDLVDELLQEGRKILVFSQFTSMLSIIEVKILQKKISYTKLTGSTRNREEVIDKFNKGEADIFLISLKAGGVGLNLTEADTVIHYDPWWNPAVENQATDRAHRIGQSKKVFVYKLIVENTIEQKILEMQKRKQALQEGIYDEDKQQDDLKFKGEELLELLK